MTTDRRWPNPVRAAAVCAVLLAACGEQAPGPVAGDRPLNRSTQAEPNTLDPHKSIMVDEWTILRDLHLGLTASDATGRPIPGAAERWTVSDDGLRYTFTLQPDLKWSDGSPLTAADFVAGLRRLFDPDTLSPAAYLLYMVSGGREVHRGELPAEALGVRAPNSRTVEIALARPTPILPAILAMPFAAPAPAGHPAATNGPGVFSGAYMLDEWRPDSHVSLVRNPHFHRAADVQIARVRYLPTPDDDVAFRLYRAGNLDMVGWYGTHRAAWLADNIPDDVRTGPARGVSYLVFNTQRPPFNATAARCAVSDAVDTAVIVTDVMRGTVTAARSFVPPTVSGYRPRGGTRPVPTTAADRLAPLGDSAESPLQFEMRVRDTPDDRRIAAALQQMWAEAGIVAGLVNTDLKTHYADLGTGNFTLADAGWALFDSPESFLMLLSRDDAGFLNYGRYSSEAFESTYSAALAENNPSRRSRLFATAEAIALDDCAVLPLYHYNTRNLVNPQLRGFADNPSDIHPSMYLYFAEFGT